MVKDHSNNEGRKDMFLFNDTLNTFYLRLYGIRYMVKNHSDSERGNLCYPVCGMMHIKEPLLLIGKNSPCGGSGFPLSLYEWSFTMCDAI